MSFQAYLDNIEDKTGLTPRQFIGLAHEKGFDAPTVKAGTIVDWLKADYDLGRGHAMALVHVIKKGPTIDAKHVRSGGTHSDESDVLWLDGKATRPQPATRIGRSDDDDREAVADRLGPIIGRWRTEGRIVDDDTPITGWDTYELAPGGFFVVHHVDVHVGDQHVQAIEIIGERDTAGGRWLARAYDGDGAVTIMHVDVVGPRAWTFSGDADVAPAAWVDEPAGDRAAVRSTLTVADDGTTMDAAWERTSDGRDWLAWMDVDFTRARRTPEGGWASTQPQVRALPS